jgi:putative Holliday junction resolvase
VRVLALDLGEQRCGLALSDAARRHASPLTTLATSQLRADNSALKRLIADFSIERLLVGLPLAADGSEGSQARHLRALAEKLLAGVDVLLPKGILWRDERYSSVVARKLGHTAGLDERAMRKDRSGAGGIDSRAAAVLLQDWLDETRATEAAKAAARQLRDETRIEM